MKNVLSGALALTLLASAGVASAQGYDNHDQRGGQAYDNRGHDDHGDNGGHHNWSRGQRLPTNYRDNRYVVNDWRTRHLRAPPRGYHWVRADNDYVLAAVATGVIASIIAGSR